MGALVTAAIAIVGLILGWVAIEMACKPCLEAGRTAIDRSLDPNYDPDDNLNRSSGLPAYQALPDQEPSSASISSSTTKV